MKINITNLRIGNYFRELSVVIIGIFITLSITNWISNYNKQKEIREILTLIEIELNENLENLQQFEHQLIKESNFLYLLQKHNLDFTQIPEEVLRDNGNTFGNILIFNPIKDAYEVFKSSSLMHYISDQELLLDLIKAYNRLDNYQRGITIFNDIKFAGRDYHNMDTNEMKKMINGKIEDYFQVVLQNKAIINYVYLGANDLHHTGIKGVSKDIREVSKKIRQKLDQ